MLDLFFAAELFLSYLAHLSVFKSAGPDGIHLQLLSSLIRAIAGLLASLFSESFETGAISTDWMAATFVHVLKKRSKHGLVGLMFTARNFVDRLLLRYFRTSSVSAQHSK